MNPLAGVFDDVELGDPVVATALSLFPLLARQERPRAYLTLDEALAGQLLRITEVSEHGRVSQLRLRNGGDAPVLIVDGEEFVGAKQNRIVNLTILVAGKAQLDLPVSCVEAGRWHAEGPYFRTAPRAFYASGRAAKAREVTASLQRTGTAVSDQRAIWEEIEAKSGRLNASSPTQACAAVYGRLETELEELRRLFAPLPGQVGGVFCLWGVPVGIELFDSPVTWAGLQPKLVASYGVDAYDPAFADVGRVGYTREAVAAWVSGIRAIPYQAFPGVGLGTDVRLTGRGLHGGALVWDERVIHLSVLTTVHAANAA